jgi:HK97 family phage major capsid protein
MTPAEEIKALLEEQAKTYTDFKAENDKRLKEIEKGGAENAVTRTNVEALNKKLDTCAAELKAATQRADELEKKLNRSSLGGGGGETDKEAVNARLFAEFRAAESKSPIQAFSVEDARNYRKNLNTYFRKGSATPADVMNGLAIGSDPDGGYWVMPDTSGRIVQKIYESSPMRQLADVQTISTDALEGPIDNGKLSSGWVAEKGSRTETTATPQVGKWRIPAWEGYVEPKSTQQLLDDSMHDPEAWLTDKGAQAFALDEATAFVTGSGSGKPRGFLESTRSIVATDDATRAWGALQYVPTGTSGDFDATIKADCLLDTVYKLKAYYRAGATWFMARATVGKVRKLKDGQGNYLWTPGSAAQPATLHGYPVAEGEDMPQVAANSLSIAFGNFKKGYQIVDRMGTRVLRDPFTSKGFVLFYMTRRVGGDLLNSEAIKLVKFSAS